jgi:uncharacterized protein (TIGR03545 family)
MIRLKVFIPALLFVGLILFIGYFRIDAWVKSWIESGISAVTQTKTDISHLQVSFKRSALHIERLAIASRDDEMKNTVEFEDIYVGFEMLPLLRKRVVFDELSVRGVAFGTTRTTSGKLLIKKDDSPSWLSQKSAEALSALKKEYQTLPAAKLLDYAVPTDPEDVMSALQLKSPEAFKASMAVAEQYRGQWASRMSEFRDLKEYEERIAESRKLAQNPPQNPEAILQAVETINKNYVYFQDEKKRAQLLINDADIDFKRIQRAYDAAKEALEGDFDRAKRMVGLDSLNVGNLSKMIFGPVWMDRVEMVLKYHALMRKTLASKREGSVEVKQRSKGREIIFLREKEQPQFVLTKSELSMKGIESGDKQLYALNINNLNSAPKLSGKHSTIEFKADLKDALMDQVLFKALWDYTTDKAKDDFQLTIEKLRANSWPVGIPVALPLRLEKGMAKVESKLNFEGDSMKWVNRIAFNDVEWNVSELPQHGFVTPVIKEVLSHAKQFDVEVELHMVGNALNFEVKSDLDKILKEAISAVVQKQLAEFQEKLHREVDNRVSAYREQANNQVSAFKDEAQKKVASYVQKLTAYADEANKLQETLKKKAGERATDSIQKNIPNVSNALKGIKNPF